MTIHHAWERYINSVYPSGALPVQLKEARRAFYAGARAVLQTTLQVCDDEVTEAEGLEVLDQLVVESQAFEARVKAGRA